MTRPLTKWAVIVSSVTSTSSMRDPTLTAVLMPSLDAPFFVVDDEATDLVQFSRAEAGIPSIDMEANQNLACRRSRRT
jgi:hypothetical protein